MLSHDPIISAEICIACAQELSQQPDIFTSSTIATKVYIFLDTQWPYNDIVDYVNYIVQRLDINPYGSAVTLLAASNGAVIANTTNYVSEFYVSWNASTHLNATPGFKLPIILSTARDLVENVMNEDQRDQSLGGQSLVALIMPSPLAYVSESDHVYCMRFLEYMNRTAPDLHFLYFVGGAVVRFKPYVNNPHKDLFSLAVLRGVQENAEPVVQRIWQIPRRLGNPRCGASWEATGSGADHMAQYIRLGAITFYRMSPNFFFGYGSMRYLKVAAVSGITFTVCTSRSIVLPYRNGSVNPPEQECSQIINNDYSYDLTDACKGCDSIQQCEPLYISVQAQNFADVTQVQCTDAGCQTPTQAQYTISVNNLNCNAANGRIKNFAILLVAVGLHLFFSMDF